MGLNMHKVVRGAIQVVNNDIDGTVYVSTGYANTRGILTPTFAAVTARLQVQADTHDKLWHERSLAYTTGHTVVYAYGNFSDLNRPTGKGGDIMFYKGMWQAITQVQEWWPDWCCVSVSQQLDAATLDALLALIKNGSVPPPAGLTP